MNYHLSIGWLYPELMSTYGDRGNIFVFKKRLLERNIKVNIVNIDFKTNTKDIQSCDLIFGGGAQDRQQGIVIDDLRKNKGPIIKEMFENDIPGLFVCGAPQLLGHYYMNGDGEKLEGLGIFDMVSKHFGKDKPRCIGNVVGEISLEFRINYEKVKARHSERSEESLAKNKDLEGDPSALPQDDTWRNTIIGFENHGGRTYLGEGAKPFANVIKGNGNNGEDGTEGAIYKNCIATYSHGPFLPKNPHIADWLLSKALEVKYKKLVELAVLDDELEWKAHDSMIRRLIGK